MSFKDKEGRIKKIGRVIYPNLGARIFVILVKPENPENIGLVARGMANTGFSNLRLVMSSPLNPKSYKTAVHSQNILDKAEVFPGIIETSSDLNILFAATAKKRKNFTLLTLKEAVERIFSFPPSTKIGLLFGNERTGLTSGELQRSNFKFIIPQASKQPSYNLAAAVLLTLFQIFTHDWDLSEQAGDKPLPWKEQQECIDLVLGKLEAKKFIHLTNKQHVTQMVYDLLGRLTMTSRDRKLLLALFSKVVEKPVGYVECLENKKPQP